MNLQSYKNSDLSEIYVKNRLHCIIGIVEMNHFESASMVTRNSTTILICCLLSVKWNYIDILFPKGYSGKSSRNPSIPRFLTILNGCR